MLQVKLKLLEKSESESSTGEASLEQSLRTLGAPMDRSVTSEMDAAGEVDSKQRNKWKELASESITVNRIHHSQSMSVVEKKRMIFAQGGFFFFRQNSCFLAIFGGFFIIQKVLLSWA